MHEATSHFLKSLITFLIVVDPIDAIPHFLDIAGGLDEASRRRLSSKAVLSALLATISFAVLGKWLLDLFGLPMSAFEIAGGLLLFTMSLDLMRAEVPRTKAHKRPTERRADELALTPLGIPILAGPGTITSALILYNLSEDPLAKISTLIALIVVFALTKLVLDKSEMLTKYAGLTVVRVHSRLMGILLATISIDFIFDGISGYLVGGNA